MVNLLMALMESVMWRVPALIVAIVAASFAPAAGAAQLALLPEAAPPGATVSIAGKGFGAFKSTQINRVTFNGVQALVQRWEPELIEVKVPLRATSGPVGVFKGPRMIATGQFRVQRPMIKSVQPAEVEPGSVLQVVGEHFGTTAGSKDPNTMFSVNDVLINGLPARVQRWRNDLIEVLVPANASSGDVVVRLASSDPLPDGSCCAPVGYSLSNAVPVTLTPVVRLDPAKGPVGTKVVLFGQGFGNDRKPDELVLFNNKPATVAQWTDSAIVVHVPLEAASGPVVLARGPHRRSVGTFEVTVPTTTGLSLSRGPVGSLVRISGQNFGNYAESGPTAFDFLDFDPGQNGVEFGGVPAVIYRWNDDMIDVWVPFSAKNGPVVIKRGATTPKADGTCCAARGIVAVEAGTFTVATPVVESYSPDSAGLDEVVTIKGSGFGSFLKTAEATQPGLNEGGHDFEAIRLGENVSRSEVLFNGVAAQVESWSDTEIRVRVPRRNVFGIGTETGFGERTTGPLLVRRGSWDVLPDGRCCTPKKWVTAEAGPFTILRKGLPNQGYYNDPGPGRD